MSESLDAIAESLSNLSIVDGCKLVKMLEEKWGISAVAPVATSGGSAGNSAETSDGKSEFNVVLTSFPADKKIAVIKVLRDILGVGLAEAKAVVDSVPKEVKVGLQKAEADEIKKKLEDAGATVELK